MGAFCEIMREKRHFLFATSTDAEAVSVLVAAATPNENKRDKALAVAKLIQYAVDTATAAAKDEKDYQNPKAAVIAAATKIVHHSSFLR